jgi:chemotaxis-related protein WspD
MRYLPVRAWNEDACWRRIGVAGDRTCPELAHHVHCRNCPVYAGAAQHNLQRPVDADYRADGARELARPEPPPARTDAAALAFRVGREWLAVAMDLAVEVAPPARAHRLPHRSRDALLGIVNVGGRLLPAVSLARLMHVDTDGVAPPPGRHAFARLLVLALGPHRYALPVDEVHGVLRHAQDAMRAPAANVGHAPPGLVAGIVADSALEAALLDTTRLRTELEGLLR